MLGLEEESRAEAVLRVWEYSGGEANEVDLLVGEECMEAEALIWGGDGVLE